uniref:Uncharacterized protein n=1 Tax=Eutreptiella gymnastica TaxID=73025 RepID=A0A7S4CBK7_9EUGL
MCAKKRAHGSQGAHSLLQLREPEVYQIAKPDPMPPISHGGLPPQSHVRRADTPSVALSPSSNPLETHPTAMSYNYAKKRTNCRWIQNGRPPVRSDLSNRRVTAVVTSKRHWSTINCQPPQQLLIN